MSASPAASIAARARFPRRASGAAAAVLEAQARRQGWRARYLKEVDAQETTLRFWQEI